MLDLVSITKTFFKEMSNCFSQCCLTWNVIVGLEPRCFESLLGLVRFKCSQHLVTVWTPGVRITLSSAGYDIGKFP